MQDTSPCSTRPQTEGRPHGLTPLFIGELLVLIANAIAFTAVAARALAAGLDSSVPGAAGSAFYAGLFAVYLAGPVLVTRIGLRAMVLATAPITLAGLAALAFAQPLAWFSGRFVMGIGTALLYVAMENWINLAAGRNVLGRMLAIYMAVYLGSYAIGQAFLVVVPADSSLALGIAATSLMAGLTAFAFAVPPKAQVSQPPPRGGIKRIIRFASIGIAASLGSGMAAGAFYALGPVYASSIGLDPDQIATFLIAVIFGASVAQVVLGMASDRMDRARLLGILCAVAGTASVVLLIADTASRIVFVAAMVWGSSGLTGYATAAALAYDAPHERPAREVAQWVLVANGIGGIIGPSLASALDAISPGRGVFLLSTAVFVALGVMVAFRRLAR
jgi:MFS family permease